VTIRLFAGAARSRAPLAAAIVGLLLAIVASALAAEGDHLVVGSVLGPTLVEPGWIADHLASWVNDHPAYAAPCRTEEVENELQYLRQLVARDQDLRDTARAQLVQMVVEGESSAKRHTDIAMDRLMPLDDEITDIDRLLIRLTALPACASATAAPAIASAVPLLQPPAPTAAPPAPAAATPQPQPTPDTATAAPTPSVQPSPSKTAAPAGAAPAPEPPQPAAAAPTAAPEPPQSSAAAADAPPVPAPRQPLSIPREDGVFVVRFDSKPLGLTPWGIRSLDAALAAADAGRNVRIAIEGCEDRGGAPEGVDCAGLTRRLKRILADRGVDDPDKLLANPR
jgi:hypothetical protein